MTSSEELKHWREFAMARDHKGQTNVIMLPIDVMISLLGEVTAARDTTKHDDSKRLNIGYLEFLLKHALDAKHNGFKDKGIIIEELIALLDEVQESRTMKAGAPA